MMLCTSMKAAMVWMALSLVASSEGFAGLQFPRSTSGSQGTIISRRAFPWSVPSTARPLRANGNSFDDEKREGKKQKRYREPEKQFATGEELKRLRNDLEILRENLRWAEATEDHARIDDLAKAIRNGEKRDPDIAYAKALQIIAETKATVDLSAHDKQVLIKRFQDRAQAARSVLPRFQLDGLWIGNYGYPTGDVLINVTYAGDTLLATKVTGDDNVPRGQITFTADLTPRNGSEALEPLKLSLDQSSLTTTKLPRFAGRGQVAKRGFVDHKFVEGQLVLFERHFSFVWVPIRHHVLFRRPTPEQTITLLRDPIAREDELENARAHVARCFKMDMTDSLARQQQSNVVDDEDGDDDYCFSREPIRRISMVADLKSLEERLQSSHRASQHRTVFWDAFNSLSKFFPGGGISGAGEDKGKAKKDPGKNNRIDEQKA